VKKILVTGNLGYIGTVLTEALQLKGYEVKGYDIGFFKDLKLIDVQAPEEQIIKDIRDVELKDVEGVDGIIHLAALCNDPLGELNPQLTLDINYKACMKLARLAKEAGVKRFVYASSQSMYGISDISGELEEDNSEKNPITEYAKTKWMAECELKEMASDDFVVSMFRPSTVFGFSPRLRCDIVYNNLVACAFTTGKIEIKSDGTPWRPVVHVKDVSAAFISGLEAPAELLNGRSFNVGLENGNYTVRDLAEAAQSVMPDSSLTFTNEHGSDFRTYRVCFDRILGELKDYFKPEWNLKKGGYELIEKFKETSFKEELFRGRQHNRLNHINHLIEEGVIDINLRFKA
jgi:nucleoside-diphosphate-sugar epimerase